MLCWQEVRKVRKFFLVLLMVVSANAWGEKYVFTLSSTPFYSEVDSREPAYLADDHQFVSFAEVDRYRYARSTLWYRARTIENQVYYFDSSRVAVDVQFVDPLRAIAKTVYVNVEQTGLDARLQPDFVHTFSTILLLDVKTRQVADEFNTPDQSDELAFDLSDPTYVKIRHSYHNVNVAAIGYAGVYYFVRTNLALHSPAFHYFEYIGAQDEARMDSRTISITDEGAQISYDYSERVGNPEAGHGTLGLQYTVGQSGHYILGEIKTELSIDLSWYNGAWPFSRSFGGKEMFGEGWYPVGSGYSISVSDLMRKFSYFGIQIEVAYLPDYLARGGTAGTITASNVNLREVPSLAGKVIDKLQKGVQVVVADRSCAKMNVNGVTEYWYKVLVGGDPTGYDEDGWVFGQFVDASSITNR
jgi:hypothetical protein